MLPIVFLCKDKKNTHIPYFGEVSALNDIKHYKNTFSHQKKLQYKIDISEIEARACMLRPLFNLHMPELSGALASHSLPLIKQFQYKDSSTLHFYTCTDDKRVHK